MQAAKLLSKADVIIYDDLGGSTVLDLAKRGARLVDVGKRGGNARSWKQEEINRLLVDSCEPGACVVRLKGGCPSVFSRASSELRALAAHDIPFDITPGVSSALAAPLLAGVPLTDRDVGRAFAVASAHSPAALNWAALAGIDTVVLLMAGRKLAEAADALLGQGRPRDDPVLVVRSAGVEGAERGEWRSTLGAVAADLAVEIASGALSPCVVVVGRVVDAVPRQ
ncbi:unnamed protein product [Pedinophyceae sp. YPF-701]|nr:unnamed protein product [Pedinophyceae sp. YPF-701]